jgi:hypothetical protein
MKEAKWLEKEVFEEVAAEATARMKNRVMCVREGYFCTECGICQTEEVKG